LFAFFFHGPVPNLFKQEAALYVRLNVGRHVGGSGRGEIERGGGRREGGEAQL